MLGFTPYTYSFWNHRRSISPSSKKCKACRGIHKANVQASITTTTDADGLFQVQVQVVYPFATIVHWPGLPSNIVLGHQVEMRQIR